MPGLDGHAFDVPMVGAGIDGASAKQNLEAENQSVLLVDKGDIGSGIAGRSRRLFGCDVRCFAPSRSMAEVFLEPWKGVVVPRMARAAMRMRARTERTSPERLRPFDRTHPIHRGGRCAD